MVSRVGEYGFSTSCTQPLVVRYGYTTMQNKNLGKWIAIGIGIGAAIGVGVDTMFGFSGMGIGVGVGVGVALGAGIGSAMNSKKD